MISLHFNSPLSLRDNFHLKSNSFSRFGQNNINLINPIKSDRMRNRIVSWKILERSRLFIEKNSFKINDGILDSKLRHHWSWRNRCLPIRVAAIDVITEQSWIMRNFSLLRRLVHNKSASDAYLPLPLHNAHTFLNFIFH